MQRLLAIGGLFLLGSTPALATTVTLQLDPAQSELAIEDVGPLFGPVPLSGFLSIEFSPDPISAATSFSMVALEATGPGGVVLSLDEDAADPGSGLAGFFPSGDQGALFFQTPLLLDTLVVPGFVNVVNSSVGMPAPLGSFATDPDVTGVTAMAISVDNVELGDLQLLRFSLLAVPEPAPAWLLLVGLLVLWPRLSRTWRLALRAR